MVEGFLMGRVAFRVLQVLLGTVGGLLVVPYAVNIDTGGTAPTWLMPRIGWLWPTALGCLLLIILLEVGDRLRGSGSTISPVRPHDPRNFGNALEQVSAYVKARQDGLLAQRIWLTFDERPSAVYPPMHLVQRVSGTEFRLSEHLGVAEVFDGMDQSMLILGAPGAGKTTQLLDLATTLARRARSAEKVEPRIPILLDLAEWSRSGRSRLWPLGRTNRQPRDFTGWLIASLHRRYRIPPPIGRAWLRENRLALLLDGLDEVRDPLQERCVAEINRLHREAGADQIVVCSREADYDRLTARLSLQGAVMIRPLTSDQVTDFLTAANPRLTGLALAIHNDAELRELLTTPLMINVALMAENNGSWLGELEQSESADRRRLIFDAYVVEVLARRRKQPVEDPERTLRAIQILADASVRLNAGVEAVKLDFETFEVAVPAHILEIERHWLIGVGYGAGVLVFATATAIRFGLTGGVVVILLWGSLAPILRIHPAPRIPRIRGFLILLAFWCTLASVFSGAVLILWWLIEQLAPSRMMLFGITVTMTAVTFGLMLWSVQKQGRSPHCPKVNAF